MTTAVDLLPENSKAIQAFLREKGWISPTAKVVQLSSAGEGNMNRTLRATLADNDSSDPPTTTTTFILKQSVPFVAKYPAIAAPQDRIVVEAAFYKSVAQSDSVQQYMPKILNYDIDARILCLEDLGGGSDMTSAYSNTMTPSESFNAYHRTSLMKWLASLHSIELTNEDRKTFVNMDMRVLNAAHIFDLPLMPDNGIDLDGFTTGLQKLALVYIEDKELRNKAKSLGEIYLGKSGSIERNIICLLHGDFYPGSFLSHDDTGVKVIDPEFAFDGPAEFDLGVFIAHCCFCGISTDDIDMALASYSRHFDRKLAFAFAGIELIRRLLGVAQLPLPTSTSLDAKEKWLTHGSKWIKDWSLQNHFLK